MLILFHIFYIKAEKAKSTAIQQEERTERRFFMRKLLDIDADIVPHFPV